MEFDSAVYLDKTKIKKIYMIGFVMIILSIACIAWASIYWEEFSVVTRNALTGKVKTRGLAPTLYGWGWGFAIGIPVVYGLMALSLDFKNPSFAVNKDGFYINKSMFRKTFITWQEVSSLERVDPTEVEIRLINTEEVIGRQSGIAKPFLKSTYITQGNPIKINNETVTGDVKQLLDKICVYYNAKRHVG